MKLLDYWLKHPTIRIPLLILLVSASPLAVALTSQYGFNLHPCVLCIYQRIPLAAMAGLAFFALLIRHPNILRPLLLLSFLGFLIGGGIAVFHVGVEENWWQGTDKCSSKGFVDTVEDLLAKLRDAPTARCDEPQWRFILTMAGWNVLYSLGMAGLMLYLFKKVKH